MKKLIAMFLCLAMMLSMFVACNGNGGNNTEDPTETQGSKKPNQETEKPADPLLVEHLADYQIIYPEMDVSTEVSGAIRELRNAIKTKFGVTLDMKSDFINQKNPIEAREILIGKTNRSETATAYAKAPRVDDYAVQIVDEKLVVIASTDEMLVLVLQSVINIINDLGEDDTAFFLPEHQFLSADEYAIEAVTINESDLSGYTIVSAQNDSTLELSYMLRDMICEKYQYVLGVTTEQLAANTEKAIVVGNTNNPALPQQVTAIEDDEYYIGVIDGKLYVYATEIEVLYQAINKVVSQTADAETNKVSLDLTDVVEKPKSTALTIMSFNLWVSNVNDDRASHVVERINLIKPDTLGVQEASSNWINRLKSALSAEYGYEGIGRDKNGGGEHSGIFYRKDTLKVIESGTKWMSKTPDVVSKDWGSTCNRIFTYVLFERISDGARFVHVNAHTEHTSDTICLNQLKVLVDFVQKNYSDVPVVLTGDLNAIESNASIQHVLSNGFENGAKLAFQASKSNTFADRIIDFCLTSEDDFIVYEYGVDTYKYVGDKDYQKENKDPSDHCPIYITLDIKGSN